MDKRRSSEVIDILAKIHEIDPDTVTHVVTILCTDDGGVIISGCAHVTEVLATVFENADPYQLDSNAAAKGEGAIQEEQHHTFSEYAITKRLEEMGLSMDVLPREAVMRLLNQAINGEDESEERPDNGPSPYL